MFSHQTARGQRPLRAFGRVMLALAILITAFVPQFTGVALPVPFSDSNSTSLPVAKAGTTYFALSSGNFSQDWTNTALITANDDWSGVPSIEGYRGDDITTATGVDPQTLLEFAGPGGAVLDVNANQTSPTFNTGGVTEFELANPTIGIQGSGTADAPFVLLRLNSTGRQSVRITYNVRDLDNSADDAAQQVALQYRVGETGQFTNLPAGYVADATEVNAATKVTAVDVTLPATANNKGQLQIRIITTNAGGNDEGVGIDDIVVSSQPDTGGGTNELTVSPTSLTFNTQQGGANPPSQNVNVGSTGASLQYSVEVSSTGWLTVTPLSGNTPASVIVSATTGSLAAGSYPGVITVTNVLTPTDFKVVNVTFVVAPVQAYTPIYQIQGSAGKTGQWKSTLVNQTVTTEGVVVQRVNSGIYIQEPNPDNDLRTSEGIFIYTDDPPSANFTIGKRVRVTGTVLEFFPFTFPGASQAERETQLTQTQLQASNANITDLGAATPITPTRLSYTQSGPFIRQIPTQTIYSTDPMNPEVDGIDFWESLEGMLVQVDNGRVIAPWQDFNEFVVVADNGIGVSNLNARSSLVITSTDFNPERIVIDRPGGVTIPNSLTTGDVITTSMVGVVFYDFNDFKVTIRESVPVTAVNTANRVTQETLAPLTDASQLRIASYNVENLDFLDSNSRFTQIADQIVNRLKSPDIITLIEIQDNNGTAAGGVSATDTITKLRTAIATAGGPTYEWRQIDPVNNQDGGQQEGNIRQVFFFRTDRGLTFVDKPGGTSTAATTVLPDGTPSFSPGRIDPTNAAFTSSRKPLVGEFLFNGQRLIVIGNHNNSKGGDQPLYGINQPPVLESETQRVQQMTVIRNFINQIQERNPNAFVVVNGDLNDFEFSNPISNVLRVGATSNGDLINGMETISLLSDRYTYKFQGNAQSLDHVLYTKSLAQRVVEVNAVHINADFPDNSQQRASDHDPVTVVFNFGNLVPCNNQNNITIAADTGDGTVCGTLSYALKNAPVATVITLSTSVTFTGALQFNVPVGVQILGGDGSCTPTKFVINGNGVAGDGLRLQGDNYLANIEVRGFAGREIVANNQNGTKNVIDCSIVRS
jgi:predicted extracellular nuclease